MFLRCMLASCSNGDVQWQAMYKAVKLQQEVSDEMSSIKDEEVLDTAEHFESKSYKSKSYKK